MRRTLATVILAVVAGAGLAGAQSAGEIADRCQLDKFKAERKKVRKVCLCYKIAIRKSAPDEVPQPDPECFAKVDARFVADIAKAEQKAIDRGGSCPSGGDAQLLCDAVDQDPGLCCRNLAQGEACR